MSQSLHPLCLYCSKPLSPRQKSFCSQKCNGNYHNPKSRPSRNCEQCHGLFAPTHQHTRFCSVSCSIAFRKPQSEDELVNRSNKECRNFLIAKFGAKCYECGWDKINPKTNRSPVELDHIDGNSSNNTASNLRLLCPNCHSLTPTYKNLNKGFGRASRRKRYREGKSF